MTPTTGFILFLFVTAFPPPGHCLDETDKARIDDFIGEVMECLEIPGLMVSAVQNGDVVIAEGYGKANLETDEDVTSTTLFNTASVSKHFTAVMLAELFQEDQRYNWDTPVREILGEDFYFSTGYRSNETNLRDMLGHKTGENRNDFAWLLHMVSREDIKNRVRFFKPDFPFRTQFTYNNHMYVLAGEVATVLDGQGLTWEQLLQERLLDKLDMADTTMFYLADEDYTGFAVPYAYDSMTRMPNEFFTGMEPMAAAALIATNAEDMGKWLQFLLGNVDDDIINSTIINELLVDEIPSRSSGFERPIFPETVYYSQATARGFFRGEFRGFRVWSHGGDLRGHHSFLSFIPSLNIGVHISVNRLIASWQRHMIHAFITDTLMGETPWVNSTLVCIDARSLGGYWEDTEYDEDMRISPKSIEQVIREGKSGTRSDRRPLAQYEGLYGNFLYTNASVFINANGTLDMEIGSFLFDLVEQEENVFQPVGKTSPASFLPMGIVEFSSSAGGETIDTLTIRTPSPGIVFTRGLNADDAPPPDLDKCQDEQ